MFPAYEGPFIRAARDASEAQRELVVGQWALIPWFAKERKLKFPTCNARSEELSEKASYKLPWARGQRCIIPAEAFFEPCWETGKHIPWRFTQPSGEPWGLAGLWNTWTDKATAELVESYTMLTINADAHPLMNRMHRPDRGCVKTPSQTRRAVSRVHRHIEHRSRYAAIRREPGSAAGHAAPGVPG
jgi:putative SOS response-associated peptidase YedK